MFTMSVLTVVLANLNSEELRKYIFVSQPYGTSAAILSCDDDEQEHSSDRVWAYEPRPVSPSVRSMH
jgi:hypothetical protein